LYLYNLFYFYFSPKKEKSECICMCVDSFACQAILLIQLACLKSTARKFYPSRQRLTLPLQPGSKERPIVLNYKKSLEDYCHGNLDHLTVVFKDLGPQVSYRTLFFFEYLGPLILYPIFYYFPVYQYFGYKEERTVLLYITGVFTTSNELWKHFSCIGSAMQPHHSPMCSVIVHIIGPLVLILLTI
jgi:hypothetical protein